jgi:hypothetical protein
MLGEQEKLNFNPMNMDEFLDEETCRERNILHVHKKAKSNFKQQNLDAWRPVPTPIHAVIFFVVVALIGLVFGIPLLGKVSHPKLVMSADIIEIKQRYDNKCMLGDTNCKLTFSVAEKMKGVVHVYYELHNFYQNHRLYRKSISNQQLSGKVISASIADDSCYPVSFIKELGNF